MSIKCDSCFNYDENNKLCLSGPVIDAAEEFNSVEINEARDICDREGDGHFVYFEPIDDPQPSAGAAVAASAGAPQ